MSLPVFPISVTLRAWPITRTINMPPVKADALGGKRVRLPLYTYPTYSYELSLNILRTAAAYQEWQALEGFIKSVYGAAYLWAFNDPNDNAVTNQEFGLGNGSATAFQLVRSLGGFTEPAFILNGTPSLYVGGTLTTPSSISPYGVVTFNSAPSSGAALTWTGSYYWPCRFDDDGFGLENFMAGFFSAKSLKFSTEKLP